MNNSRLNILPSGVDLLLFDTLSGTALVNAILELNRYQTPLQREQSGLNKYLRERIIADFIGEDIDEYDNFINFTDYILGIREFDFFNPDNENTDPDGIGDSRDLTLDPLLIYGVFSTIANELVEEITPQDTIEINKYLSAVYRVGWGPLIDTFKNQTIKNLHSQDWARLYMILLLYSDEKKSNIFETMQSNIPKSEIYTVLSKIISMSQQTELGTYVMANLLDFLINNRNPFPLNLNSNQVENLFNMLILKHLGPKSYKPYELLNRFKSLK